MAYEATVRKYLKDIQEKYKDAQTSGQYTSELSFRVPLDNLFKGLAHDLNPTANVSVILEPKSQGRVGRPDWRIHESSTLGIFGYIEAKGPSELPFDTTPYTKQIQKYLTLGHNLVITDGIDFVFCMKSMSTPTVISLFDKSKMPQKNWARLSIDPRFEVFMRNFFDNPSPQRINEEKLVELVAIRTRNLADDIADADIPIEQAMNDSEKKIIELLTGIKKLIYNHNDMDLRNENSFAGFTAQVIMFCLLYAHRVLCESVDSPAEKERKIREFVNKDFTDGEILSPFRNLMVYLRDNADESMFINQWIDECIKFLSFVQMTEEQLLNPDYHRLFEMFLAKYDPKARFDYGAFYTPRALADFVVKTVNYVVARNFDGACVYDGGNTIIDPCCGTGSFLEQIIRHDKGDGEYNLCGIEILPTPYMLANYRMAVVDKQLQKHSHSTEIILANTLCNGVFGEPVNENSIEGKEIKRASELSSLPLKLIIGNPPSSDAIRENSSDDFTIINSLMENFRPPEEGRHSRQNTQKQVNNPFMQFIRWSCKKLFDSRSHSVLAFVVPLSFLDAESYQYARKYLCENFSDAWVVAIDADARTGVRTDSFFATLQGRAVVILTHKYGESNNISSYHFYDCSKDSKKEKADFFGLPVEQIIEKFSDYEIDARYKLLPSEAIDEELYSKFWPISDENGKKAVFINHCSGIKLGGTSLLTNVKDGMLRRRSRDIMNDGVDAAISWTKGSGQRKADDAKILDFQERLKKIGNSRQVDSFIIERSTPYSFRPFLTSRLLLWKELLQDWKDVGGGGTRYRGEIMEAYSERDTIGFSVAHAPKDIDSDLGQFVSFCWYYPDNDLCSRGNGHIYMNQYPEASEMKSNINNELTINIVQMSGLKKKEAERRILFYAYAVMCSQVYLEKFRGALYTPNQSDARARIPFVADKQMFLRLSAYGEKIANLEKTDHKVENLLGYDYDAICDSLPVDFKIIPKQPFDEINEELVLQDDSDEVRIHCPLYLQKLSIAGYEVIKTWLKFNSYASTHCTCTREDMRGLLNFLNSLAMHVEYVAGVDEIMHDVIDEKIGLIKP